MMRRMWYKTDIHEKERGSDMQDDVIAAVATPPGRGGVSIVRVSGVGAIEKAGKVFRSASGSPLTEAKSFTAHFGHVMSADEKVIDECIALVMRAPHTYTTEDVVELQLHGSPIAVRETLSALGLVGVRMADRGEFTKRAFLGGRIDLSEAQAVMDIVSARSTKALGIAEGRLSGRFSDRIRALQGEVKAVIAHLEALIDFPEEGVEDIELRDITDGIHRAVAETDRILASADTGRIYRDGLRTAIIGKPNVGKSSLLNYILGEERAIVTDIPGTTRDSIEESTELGGVPLAIADTAGIRETGDEVERIGVERSKRAAEGAELVLALFDGSRKLDAEDDEIMRLLSGRGKGAAALLTKSDLPQVVKETELAQRIAEVAGDVPHIITITTKNGTVENAPGNKSPQMEPIDGTDDTQQSDEQSAVGMAALIDVVKELVGERTPDDEILRDEREAEILRRAKGHLEAAEKTISEGLPEDFISIDMRSAWEALGEITGETAAENIIDEIFSRFCIGK